MLLCSLHCLNHQIMNWCLSPPQVCMSAEAPAWSPLYPTWDSRASPAVVYFDPQAAAETSLALRRVHLQGADRATSPIQPRNRSAPVGHSPIKFAPQCPPYTTVPWSNHAGTFPHASSSTAPPLPHLPPSLHLHLLLLLHLHLHLHHLHLHPPLPVPAPVPALALALPHTWEGYSRGVGWGVGWGVAAMSSACPSYTSSAAAKPLYGNLDFASTLSQATERMLLFTKPTRSWYCG